MANKQRITEIYVDMDDVLTIFTPHVLFELGCKCDKHSYDYFLPEWGWDMLKGAQALHPNGADRFPTTASFWESVKEKHWLDSPLSELGMRVMQLVRSYDADVYILTSPTICPECYSGKAKWVRHHYPEMMRKLIVTPAKHTVAKPNALLIDDGEHNTTAFREAGGQTVTVPRPWNNMWIAGQSEHDRNNDTINYIMEALA